MKIIASKNDLSGKVFKDRIIYKGIGREGPIISGKMTVGFGDYSSDIGTMEAHQHAEETVYIVSAEKAYIRRGESKDTLEKQIPLKMGMLVHFDEMEWHVFDCDQGGHVTILFIYGQVDKIRPEEIN